MNHLILALLFALAPGLRAASGSETKACSSFDESLDCSANCWEKAKGPCSDGSASCQANSKACGSGADSAASWGAVALYGAGVVALVALSVYLISNSGGHGGVSLPGQDTVETAADLDLLPTRALSGGA